MIDIINSSSTNAYKELLEIVPDLSQKIETKKLVHQDILKIARTVFFKKEPDGSISLEKASYGIMDKIPDEQLDLIRRVCSLQSEQGENPEVRIVRKNKRKHEDVAPQTKQGTKRKQISEPENTRPPKKAKQEKIREVEDFFGKELGLPVNLMTLTAEYISEAASAIVAFASEGPEKIPQYLKDNMTTLDLSKEECITTETFLTIITEFKNLKSIKLHEDADDFCLEALSKALPNLTDLAVQGGNITVDSFSHISSLKNLRTLKLEKLGYQANERVKNAVKGAENLEVLQIGKSGIKDDALEFISQNCTNLKSIDVSMCFSITKLGINSIIKNCPDLRELNLDSIKNLDDDVLENLGKHCHKLTKLYLYISNEITDEGLKHLSSGCPDLIDIQMHGLAMITDEGIQSLTQGIKSLQRLMLATCSNITSKGIGYISEWKSSLKCLEIYNCTKIVGGIFNNLSSDFPALECLKLYLLQTSKKDVQDIAKLFPSIKLLHIVSAQLSSDVISDLKGLQNLETLAILPSF